MLNVLRPESISSSLFVSVIVDSSLCLFFFFESGFGELSIDNVCRSHRIDEIKELKENASSLVEAKRAHGQGWAVRTS